jgi:hypothetical protein
MKAQENPSLITLFPDPYFPRIDGLRVIHSPGCPKRGTMFRTLKKGYWDQ